MDAEERARSLQELIETDGWPIVDQFINERIADNTNQLLTCPAEKITEHRAMVKAFNSVFLFIQGVIDDAQEDER
jgi:hypothetical protein